MKKGWEIKKLNDIIESNVIGLTKNSSEQDIHHKFKYVKMNNITRGNCFDISKYTCVNATKEELEKYSLFDGDFLFNTRNSYELVGKTCLFEYYNNEVILYNNNIMRIRFIKAINSFFINYAFSTDDLIKKLDRLKRGTTNVSAIYYKDLKNLELLIPPLPEQNRIVAILDEAFAAIAKAKANAQQNLKNAKGLFESYLEGVFENKGEGWEEKMLGEVLVKTETVDPTKKPNQEFIYLDVSSVNKETKEIENPTILLGKDAPSRARKLVRTNDVIFATVRPTQSRVALVTEEYDNQVCSTGYFVLRAKEFLSNNLVYYFLLTYSFKKQMERLQKGASYPAVADSEVKGIYISFPKSFAVQQTIIQKLDVLYSETKKLEAIYQQKINDLDELKKAVLQKAFNGEFSVKEIVV